MDRKSVRAHIASLMRSRSGSFDSVDLGNLQPGTVVEVATADRKTFRIVVMHGAQVSGEGMFGLALPNMRMEAHAPRDVWGAVRVSVGSQWFYALRGREGSGPYSYTTRVVSVEVI